MKRYFLSLFVAILTFLLGVSVVGIFILFAPIPEVEDIESKCSWYYQMSEQENNVIKVVYLKTHRYKNWSMVFFEIKNNSSETIYYRGFKKDSNLSAWIKQNNKVEKWKFEIQPKDIKRQELELGESAIFQINIPHNNEPFEAGFGFKIGKQRKEKILWTEVKNQAIDPIIIVGTGEICC